MKPLNVPARGAARIQTRAGLCLVAVSAALSLSIACGSAQGDAGASAGAGAGASGGDGLAGGGASSGAAGQSAGGSSGASGGSAGVPGGSGGASSAGAGAGGSLAAAGSGGSSGKGGAGAGGANGGNGGAAQVPACPALAPLAAASCDSDGQVCSYEDCAGAGRTVATCQKQGGPRDTWNVRSVACGVVHCSGLPGVMTCPSGQVCSVTQSGTISGMCVQATCGTGPLTCACAHASCTDCTILGGAEMGFTVTCNNCPQGGCA